MVKFTADDPAMCGRPTSWYRRTVDLRWTDANITRRRRCRRFDVATKQTHTVPSSRPVSGSSLVYVHRIRRNIVAPSRPHKRLEGRFNEHHHGAVQACAAVRVVESAAHGR
jgi:hypothetical protein